MELQPGVCLGPYEIETAIGTGGMGEVYRARDLRLGRVVAVKILANRFSENLEARRRFEREARAISRLSHPNICTLYDVGNHNGLEYLVMEYLQGETLQKCLSRGPLPAGEVIRTGIQIADALDQVHRVGIVYRDLKPGNIMLTRSGAKLLDFGLIRSALDREETQPESAIPNRPPLGDPHLTESETLLGTPQYMAPEQIERKPLDGRTDVFALGAVLYEAATGREAFAAGDWAALTSAILTRDPPPLADVQTPRGRALDRVIRKCLAKDPEERWQHVRDLRTALEWAGGDPAGDPAESAAGSRVLPWKIIAPIVLLAAVCGWILHAVTARQPAATPSVRFEIAAPDSAMFGNSFALSPDGRQIIFTAKSGGKAMLWLRNLASIDARPIIGTQDGIYPFWSPDSRWIGFFADGQLKKIPLSGGPAVALADASDPRGGAWSRRGIILFAPTAESPLLKISDHGRSIPVPATQLDAGGAITSDRWPSFLPNGSDFLYLAYGPEEKSRKICVGSLDSLRSRMILRASSSAAYAAPGKLIYSSGGALVVQKFDPRTLRLTGDAGLLAQDVAPIGENGPSGYARFSVSDNGVLAFRSDVLTISHLTWFDRSGQMIGTLGPPGMYDDPEISPDGRHIIVDRLDPKTQANAIWIFDLQNGGFSPLTFNPASSEIGCWSPDGSQIVYASNREGSFDLYRKVVSGATPDQLLLRSPFFKFPTDWSRDGRFLLFDDFQSDTITITVLPLTGTNKGPFSYLEDLQGAAHGRFSPDHHWVAYTSRESGRPEVYIQSFPAGKGKWQISTDGGDQPVWSASGKEIYFLSRNLDLMAVRIRAGTVMGVSAPRVLFPTRAAGSFALQGTRNSFTVTPDDRKFLVNTVEHSGDRVPITVVVNGAAGPSRD